MSAVTPGWRHAQQHHDLKTWLDADQQTPLYFQHIQAGGFRMGSRGQYADEEPAHRVEITKPFYMSTFPVTQAQWRAVVRRFPDSDLKADPSHFSGDLRPVENVSWHDANKWCQLLADSGSLQPFTDSADVEVEVPHPRLELPSEAQWEYACRAATQTDYYTGDGEASLQQAGWYSGNSKEETHEVGLKARNLSELYDMHGNVWEWCRDAWTADAYKSRIDGVEDPVVDLESAVRVIRGGSWILSARLCRAAYRGRRAPGLRFRYQGFRVCLFSGPEQPSDRSDVVA